MANTPVEFVRMPVVVFSPDKMKCPSPVEFDLRSGDVYDKERTPYFPVIDIDLLFLWRVLSIFLGNRLPHAINLCYSKG